MPGTDLPLLQGRKEKQALTLSVREATERHGSQTEAKDPGEDKPWAMVKCESDPRGEGLGTPRFKFSLAGTVYILFASLCGTVCLCWLYWSPSGLCQSWNTAGAWLKWKRIPRRAHQPFYKLEASNDNSFSRMEVKFSTGKVIKEKEGLCSLGQNVIYTHIAANPDNGLMFTALLGNLPEGINIHIRE